MRSRVGFRVTVYVFWVDLKVYGVGIGRIGPADQNMLPCRANVEYIGVWALGGGSGESAEGPNSERHSGQSEKFGQLPI